MKKYFLLFLVPVILLAQQLRLKRIAFLPSGPDWAYILCADSDHDGMNELIFTRIVTTYVPNWEIWEYRPINHYELVYADTSAFPYPPGITTGNFEPNDVGDIDQDSLTDLLGPNKDQPPNPDTLYNVVTTQEDPNYISYPQTISWWNRFSYNEVQSAPFYFSPDLDQDNMRELLFLAEGIGITHIFENRGNNQNDLVWSKFQVGAWSFAFGDFDLDGRKEFVTADLGSSGRVSVYENTGPDQYEMSFQDTVNIPNGADVLSGNDLDGDGKPEFFVSFAQLVGGDIWDFYLYMWEAIGNNTYQRTMVDHVRRNSGVSTGSRSFCSDIDGDGIEELIWSTRTHLSVYKATGNNQFQLVWEWINDHESQPINIDKALVNCYDMNQNGYNEIVFGGNAKTSIFEVEAIKVLRPNGGEIFQARTQQLIRWQTFHPPRCDSLSLFYSLDNSRTYDTIITGISGADTSYLWTVPDTSSDSCKVKIIAYGPGWQYDESDGVFSITPAGIEESRRSLSSFRFEMLPNPAKGKIRFKIWNADKDLTIKIYNLTGELVKSFSLTTKNQQLTTIFWNGKDDRGKTIPTGVYIYRLKTSDGISETKEFVILK
jgi:hypothetical protein